MGSRKSPGRKGGGGVAAQPALTLATVFWFSSDKGSSKAFRLLVVNVTTTLNWSTL